MGEQYFHRGIKFEQCWQLFPILKSFYTDFENSYEPDFVQSWMISNSWFPVSAVVAYLLFCYFGTIVMKRFKPFDLKHTLACWNLLLSIFSTWGMIRTVPHLYYDLFHKGFQRSICETPAHNWGSGATGFAVQMFILSKFPELFDTYFIVMRKKPLIFLHWYHHVTVLLYCWHSYVTEASNGLYFITMNYSVHAVMYFYFFLAAVKLVPKWFPTWLITAFQISQMAVGVLVVSSALYYHFVGSSLNPPVRCSNQFSNLLAGAVMYASYLLLFLKFAVEKFIFPSSNKIKKVHSA